MPHFTGTFTTNNIIGDRVITGLGFQPQYLRFTLSQKTSTAEDFVHQSQGFTDGVSQGCQALYWDTSGGKSAQFTNRVINHINRVSGVLTDQIVARKKSFDVDGFTLTFDATVSGYRVHVEAW